MERRKCIECGGCFLKGKCAVRRELKRKLLVKMMQQRSGNSEPSLLLITGLVTIPYYKVTSCVKADVCLMLFLGRDWSECFLNESF